MWRTVVILLLTGLLAVSVIVNIVVGRQVLTERADADRLRARAVAAEATRGTLESQLEQARAQAAFAAASGTPVVPAPSVASGPDRALVARIQDQVVRLRGLQPKRDVPLRMLDENALRQYFVSNFERDYLPQERESDQKLLTILGLMRASDSIEQILLEVLQEQVIGVYDEDDKVMYIVADKPQFGPEEKDTFAHEFTHVLQDQYYDLATLAPKHPENDDRSLAIQAVIEGDAVLIQRLWAQENLSAEEGAQLGQSGADSKLFSAPLFVREQLLFPYGEGFNFVRRVYQTGGGYGAIDQVFRDPPDSTEQVLHPEKYRAREKPVDVALPDVTAALGEGWRKINSNVMGELDIRLVLEQLTDASRATRGSSGWGGDRWLLLDKDGRQALVLKTVWDSDADARNFLDTFGLAMRNRFAGARQEEGSSTRQALTAPTAATEVRRNGRDVLVVISFDRPSAEAIMAVLG
ncbi:MAG: hypothetical protein M3336_17465 [Chloroflexota bacterium]|nr:hypothetical protein [Chloroflexota bacterium]